jgi:histidine triad (HIT) family protein
MKDKDCIFCKIVSGVVYARILKQNERAIAFLDAFPLSPGHTLVIPKSHYSKIQDLSREDLMDTFEIVRRIVSAVEIASDSTASIIAIHNGRDAGQEIPHMHVHIVPRKKGDGAGAIHSMFKAKPNLSPGAIDAMCEKIMRDFS